MATHSLCGDDHNKFKENRKKIGARLWFFPIWKHSKCLVWPKKLLRSTTTVSVCLWPSVFHVCTAAALGPMLTVDPSVVVCIRGARWVDALVSVAPHCSVFASLFLFYQQIEISAQTSLRFTPSSSAPLCCRADLFSLRWKSHDSAAKCHVSSSRRNYVFSDNI